MNLVVRLVARTQRREHLDCGLLVRLFHQHGLEAALQGGVPLDVLAVLFLGGRAHRLQFAASERRFHHVACIDRALRRPCADDGMNLVDEQDNLALCLPHLVEYSFEAFLELATELRARDKPAHIEGEYAAFLEFRRHIACDDALRQALGDGSFADARTTDQYGVVLSAAN